MNLVPIGTYEFFPQLVRFLHLLAGEGVWGRGRHLSPSMKLETVSK